MAEKAAAVGKYKEDARDNRLKLNTNLEEKIDKEWRHMALEACDLAVKAYWVCRQEAGLSVIWACRDANDAMKKCIADYTGNQPAWEAYRAGRFAELAPAYFAHRERMLEAKREFYAHVEGDGGEEAAKAAATAAGTAALGAAAAASSSGGVEAPRR